MEAIFSSETSAFSEIHGDETQKTLLFMRYEVFIATSTYIVTFGFLLFSEIVASPFAWNMNGTARSSLQWQTQCLPSVEKETQRSALKMHWNLRVKSLLSDLGHHFILSTDFIEHLQQ